jgi:hypothetical protein
MKSRYTSRTEAEGRLPSEPEPADEGAPHPSLFRGLDEPRFFPPPVTLRELGKLTRSAVAINHLVTDERTTDMADGEDQKLRWDLELGGHSMRSR